METKKDVYVVVDTPKKAKKLKKVLDMFREEFNLTDSNAIKTGSYKGSAKLYDAFNKAYFAGINWTLMPLAESKTKVSIKELRNILAKEHLKPKDVVVCEDPCTQHNYIHRITEIKGNSIYFDRFYQKDGIVDINGSCGYEHFIRYATPEEIALLEPKPKELVVGKWYHSKSVTCLFYLSEIKEKYRENKGFGIKNNNEWYDNRETAFHFGKAYEVDNFIEATPQEVESALIEEAKSRGYKVGNSKCLKDGKIWGFDSGQGFEFTMEANLLYLDASVVFSNGKWATIIEQDKFAELKEAHNNGAVIECLQTDGTWLEIKKPQWQTECEYRIKPKEKTNIGDVCKFWDEDESKFVISNFRGIIYSDFKASSLPYIGFKNCTKLTKQQLLDLFPNL